MGDAKKTIAYLLGAGASANCLPVVCNMSSGIQKVIDDLEKVINKDQKNALFEIFRSLRELKDICNVNHSVDTYAKKLLLSGKLDEYANLKDKLTLYFTLQQKLVPVDNRYDNFWAAILNSRSHFPDNLRVLSWNYDSQVELSYMGFASNLEISKTYLRLNMASMHTELRYFDPNKFSIIKLNGSAKYKRDSFQIEHFDHLISDFKSESLDSRFFNELIRNYKDISLFDDVAKKRANINELSFAWEHGKHEDFHEKLKESLKDVSVLAAIGYSFPIYNRKIDKLIINEYMPNLEKVYLQAPDARDLKDRFLSITDRISDIVLKTDIGQFVFPNELDI